LLQNNTNSNPLQNTGGLLATKNITTEADTRNPEKKPGGKEIESYRQ